MIRILFMKKQTKYEHGCSFTYWNQYPQKRVKNCKYLNKEIEKIIQNLMLTDEDRQELNYKFPN